MKFQNIKTKDMEMAILKKSVRFLWITRYILMGAMEGYTYRPMIVALYYATHQPKLFFSLAVLHKALERLSGHIFLLQESQATTQYFLDE